MAVSSQGAPRNNRIPRVNVETRLRVENPVADTGDLLLIAPKTTNGSGIVNRIYTIANEDQATTYFGLGSIGHRMFRAWQAQSPFSAVQMMVLADSGTKRVVTIEIDEAVTTAGTIRLTIGSDVIQVDVDSADTEIQVAAKIRAAVNGSVVPLQFTAGTGSDENIVLTARNGGVVNNTATIAFDANGTGGVEATITQTTAGAGDYDYSTVEAAVSDELFDVIVPCDLGVQTNGIQTLLTKRWNAVNARYGVEIQAVQDTLTNLIATYGNQDHAYRAYIGVSNQNPSPTYEIGAAAGQQIYARYANDPVLSYNNLPLSGIGAPALENRFNEAARQTILNAHIGTVKYDKDGTCRLESVPLAWTPDGGGFYYLSNLFTVMYVGRIYGDLLEQYISNFKFVESTAADGGSQALGRIPPGGVTLETIRGDCVAQYLVLRQQGIVEDIETFTNQLVVRRVPNKPSELEVILPVNIGNAVRTINLINSWTQ